MSKKASDRKKHQAALKVNQAQAYAGSLFTQSAPKSLFPLRPMLAVVAAAVVLRILFWVLYQKSPFFHVPVVDASTFNLWAQAITDGRTFMPGVFFKPPLYAYFLSFMYNTFGTGVVPVYIVQSILGCGTCILVLGIGRIFLQPRAALTAAITCALLPVLPFFELQLLAETLTTLLTMLGLFLVLRAFLPGCTKSNGLLFVAGLAIGCAALGRPNLLIVPPLLAIWIYLRAGRERLVLPAVMLLIGAVLAVSPATFYNLKASGKLVPVSANMGVNLWAGNHPAADGVSPIQIGAAWDDLQLMTSAGGANDPEAASQMLTKKTLQEMTDNPLRTSKLWFKKAIVMFSAHEARNNISAKFLATDQGVLPLQRWWPGFWLLGPFAVLGLIAAARSGLLNLPAFPKAQQPLLIYVLALAITVLPFFVNSRFRMPLLPVLALYGAIGFHGLWALIKQKSPRQLGVATLLFVALVLLVNIDWYDLGNQRTIARDEMNLAAIYAKGYAEKRPNLAEAGVHFQKGALIDRADPDIPERAGLTLQQIGLQLAQRTGQAQQSGDFTAAARYAGEAMSYLRPALDRHQAALRIFPGAFRSLASVANVHLSLGQIQAIKAEMALANADTAAATVEVDEALRNFDAARRAYGDALNIKSSLQIARTNLQSCGNEIMALPPLSIEIRDYQEWFRKQR